MIVVSAGMVKSGSGWYFNMTNELLVLSGHQDTRYIKKKYRLQRIMRYENCNIEYPILPVMLPLCYPHLKGNTFVVKTHQAPTPTLKWMIEQQIVKATYLYRDPRDVVVSALEHGLTLKKQNKNNPFVKLNTIEKSIKASDKWIRVWKKWLAYARSGRIYILRYEDLLEDTYKYMGNLVEFLGIPVSEANLESVIQKYTPANLDKEARDVKLHFNKGQVGNYRNVLNEADQKMVDDHFRAILPEMGYEA